MLQNTPPGNTADADTTASTAALVRDVRDRLVATEDTVCLERARLVTDIFRQQDGEPRVLVRARAFAHVLANMTLDLTSNPIFAGNTSSKPRAWMLIPEHGCRPAAQVLHENPGLESILDGAIPHDITEFWKEREWGGNADPGHLAVDLDVVVHQGLQAPLRKLRALKAQGTPRQQNTREAMAICLQAVIDWAGRYARAAEAAAAAASDPLRRQCLLRIAEACQRVPAQPSRTLFEGLQAIVLIQLALTIEGHGMSVSVGLPDRVLAAFVDSRAERTSVTPLLAAFMLKLTANSVFGRGSKTQAITVGGADHSGRDCCNLLTECFLEAADMIRVGDPHLFLRWHPGLPKRVRDRASDLLAAGLSMPLLINDPVTASGFVNAGMTEEDAWRYCVVGCNELGVPGLSAESANARAGTIQYLETLNQVLLQHADPDSIQSAEALLALVEKRLRQQLRADRQRYIKHVSRLPEVSPVPFTSSLMDGCIEAGDDMINAMRYRLPGLYERGLSNAANAFAAIDKQVFQNRYFAMSTLVEAMVHDFAGDSEAILQAVRQAPKWGSGARSPERWALALLDMRERVVSQIDTEFDHPGHLVCHVVRSLHHFDGKRILASPDGRHAYAPVGDSVGATAGTAAAGATAVLNSVTKIDAPHFYRGGYNLNITIAYRQARPATVRALIEGFFGNGGQELQINSLDPQVLREAQKRPEKHGDIVVRFAGLSSRFVDLSEVEQTELIARAEEAGGTRS